VGRAETLRRLRERTAARKAAGLIPDYRGGAAPKAAPAGPCVHRGRELTGPERQAAGLGHARRWTLCLHPDAPLGPHACPCRGCNSSCPGFEPEVSP
jgi:hypothetical protein